MKYTITYIQEGLETPVFNLTEDAVLEAWESDCCDNYNYVVMDSDGKKYMVADYGDYMELVEY